MDLSKSISTALLCLAFLSCNSHARSGELLLSDYRGLKLFADDSAPCTSADAPIVADSQVSTKFDDTRGVWDALWNARLQLEYAGLCTFKKGDWVFFEGRTRGVPVRRGRAEVMDDLGWTGNLENDVISSVLPPESTISAFLDGHEPKEPLPTEALIDLYNASNDPAERREIAFLIGENATEVQVRTPDDQNLMVEYLTLAAESGHPVAMFKLTMLSGLPNLIYEATANVATSSDALAKLEGVLPTKAGSYLFSAADANYVEAVKTIERAERFGLVLSEEGVALSDTPTLRNVDAAVNSHLQARSLGTLVPWAASISHCDGTWCYVAGGSKFRITVDGVSCTATGKGAASCVVTARFILTNDFEQGQNWQKQFLSATTNAAPFNFSAELATAGMSWKIVRMK